jgi:elongation factor Ts
MAITAKDVMDLRNKTGLGMMECKAALSEANGDIQAAIDLLRKKGLAKMDTRTDRASAEGRVAVSVLPDKTKGAIVEVNTETDFTAKSEVFTQMMKFLATEALKQPAGEVVVTDVMRAAIDDVRIKTKENVQFARGRVVGGASASRVGAYAHFTGKVATVVELDVAGLSGGGVSDELLQDLCMHVTAISPTPIGINESDIPAAVIEKEKEIAKAQAIEQGKPEAIAEKMVTGKLRKFFEEHLLPMQLFVKDDKKRVKDILPQGVAIKAFVRYQVGVK